LDFSTFGEDQNSFGEDHFVVGEDHDFFILIHFKVREDQKSFSESLFLCSLSKKLQIMNRESKKG